MKKYTYVFFIISISVILLSSCTNKASKNNATNQNNNSDETKGISPTPPNDSPGETEVNWSYEQLLDESDVELDGFSYDKLTSDQVLMLYSRLLSDGDEQRLNLIFSENLHEMWAINNTLFHGITPLTISDVEIKESTYRPFPEAHDVPNTDTNARYELSFNQGPDGYFDAQPEDVFQFVDLIKIDGYWKIDMLATSP